MLNYDYTVEVARKCLDTAVTKTGEAVELSKLYIEKTKIKHELNMLYEKIGKAYYLTKSNEKNQTILIDKLFNEIKSVKKQLKKAEENYKEYKYFCRDKSNYISLD